jgi:hypothetical protein
LDGLGPIARLLLVPTLLAPAATCIALALGAPAGIAQTLRPALADEGPLPRLRARTLAPERRPDPAGMLPAPEPPPATPPPVEATAEAGGESAGIAAGIDDSEAQADIPPSGVVATIRDGEPETADPITQPIDGTIEPGQEPYRNPDGADPRWDARLTEDRAAFQSPPAGFDPQLYQAEIAPLEDRRPGRLFRLEPWEPRGIRVGSFVAFPTVDLGAAWISNLFRTAPARADRAVDLRPDLRLASDWSRHALELRATGGLSFLDDHPSEDDRAWRVESRGRLDVTRRTSLTGLAQHDVTQIARGSLEALRFGATRGDVTTDLAALTFDHRFNRLSLQFRGTMQSRVYDDVTSPAGVVTSSAISTCAPPSKPAAPPGPSSPRSPPSPRPPSTSAGSRRPRRPTACGATPTASASVLASASAIPARSCAARRASATGASARSMGACGRSTASSSTPISPGA